MDDLYEFEVAGLVSKVVAELQNHLGVIDKTLAEFVIAQRLEADTSDSFKHKMKDIAADNLSTTLIDSIDRLVCLLHPAMKAKGGSTNEEPGYQRSLDQKVHDFTGLSVP